MASYDDHVRHRRAVDFLQDAVAFHIVELLAGVVVVGKWYTTQELCFRFVVAIDEGLVFEACNAPRRVS